MTTIGVAALLAAPVTASAAKPAGHGSAKAYGKACQGQSRTHVKGEKGTAFSRCVKAAHPQKDKEEQDSEPAGS